jgi:hypothetical protein
VIKSRIEWEGHIPQMHKHAMQKKFCLKNLANRYNWRGELVMEITQAKYE